MQCLVREEKIVWHSMIVISFASRLLYIRGCEGIEGGWSGKFKYFQTFRELKILGKFIGFIPLEFSHFSADENLDDMFL